MVLIASFSFVSMFVLILLIVVCIDVFDGLYKCLSSVTQFVLKPEEKKKKKRKQWKVNKHKKKGISISTFHSFFLSLSRTSL